jgi:glycosyltransferase involved in cell wall biosynthesis
LGTARPEQGVDLSLGVADAVCAAAPGVRFLFQAPNNAAGLERAEQLRARGGHIRADVVAGPLSRNAYLRQLLDCDLVLLPYWASNYAMRASGVFADALAMGVPVVVPAQTWMADRLGEGWGAGEVFTHSDVAEIRESILRALASLPALKARAAQRQSAWRAAHSVSAYLDLVLDWLGRAGVG